MAKLYNLAVMTVASTGAGTITLGSPAIIGGVQYLSFASAGVQNSEAVAYSINDPNGASEAGTGVYTTSGTTLTRTPVTSTNGNAAINMSAAAIVRISPSKADLANLREDNTFTGTQTINPTPGSFSQGVNITHSSPVGGSFAGPISFDTINVVDQGVTITGSGVDSFGLDNRNVVGFRVNYSSAGGDIRGAMIAAYRVTASVPGSYYGAIGSIYANVPNAGLLWGQIGSAQLGSAGSAQLLIGTEGEVAVYGSGTVAQRIGVNANSQGPNQATTDLDVAYSVSAGGGLAGAAPFKKMFAISKVLLGTAPLDATGDIFWADTAFTIANVFNSLNWTVTGNFADFPKFGISGATGQASFGRPISTVSGSTLLTVNANLVGPATAGGNVLLQMNGSDGNPCQMLMDNYGTGTFGSLSFRQARGIGSVFTVSKSGDNLGLISFVGATATNTFGNTTGGSGAAIIAGNATEDWSPIAQGARLKFLTTWNGTNSVSLSMVLQKGLSLASSADPGAGAILLNPQAFSALPAASSTIKGAFAVVTDSTTAVKGNTITGGGANIVLAFCNGTNWIVI